MKDLRIEFRFKNASLLKRLRERFGEEASLKSMAEKMEVSYSRMVNLLTLYCSPFSPSGGRSIEINGIWYTKFAIKIADFLYAEPAEIFPLSLYSLRLPKKYYKEFESVQLLSFQEAAEQKLLPPAETYGDDVDAPMLADGIRGALASLTEREAMVIRMRFGLDGVPEKPLEEVGEVLGVSRERIRQIEKKALRKLRHPSKKLKPFYEDNDHLAPPEPTPDPPSSWERIYRTTAGRTPNPEPELPDKVVLRIQARKAGKSKAAKVAMERFYAKNREARMIWEQPPRTIGEILTDLNRRI